MFEDNDRVAAALASMHHQSVGPSNQPETLENEADLRAEIDKLNWRHLLTQELIDAEIKNGTARQNLLPPEPPAIEAVCLELDSLEKIKDLDALAAILFLYGVYGECERSNALIRSVVNRGVWGLLLQDRLDRQRPVPQKPVKKPSQPKQHKELRKKGQWPRLPSLLDFADELERIARGGDSTSADPFTA